MIVNKKTADHGEECYVNSFRNLSPGLETQSSPYPGRLRELLLLSEAKSISVDRHKN